MDDSFLDDVDLIMKDDKEPKSRPHFNQHITTRRSYANSPPETSKLSVPKIMVSCHSSERKKTAPAPPDKQQTVKPPLKPERKSSDPKQRTPKTKTSSGKPEEFRTKFKVLGNRGNLKEQNRVEKPSKESSSCSDASSKENSQPMDSSQNSRKSSDSSYKRPILSDAADVTAFVNMVKDLISSYTKAETAKILRSVSEMHLDAKANLLQQLFLQTDDLLEELKPSGDVSRVKALVAENERLREDLMILQMRNEELRRKVQEAVAIKEENIELKMRIKELSK